MTRAEADAEAKKRWGPFAGAQVARRSRGKSSLYAIGITTLTGKAFTFAAEKSFEAAFAKAEKDGVTPEKVAAIFKKHENRLKRRVALTAFLNLFRSV